VQWRRGAPLVALIHLGIVAGGHRALGAWLHA
jgi:hypothetical protein